MEQVVVEGLRIAYRRVGNGPALVLLNGFFGDSRAWRPQLEELADEFELVAWDNPGCGESDDPPAAFRMLDFARVLAAFIDRLGLRRPHVLGLSFGSTLALELYRQRMDLPASLILASAYAGWTGSLPAAVVAERLRKTLPDLDRPPDEVVAEYNVPGLLTPDAPPGLVAENAAIMSSFHPAGMKAMTRALAEADLREVLPHVSVPTLLIYGDRDVRSPVKIGEDLHAQIPRSELVVIPGVGHLCNLEAAERFNAEVRRFLRSALAQYC